MSSKGHSSSVWASALILAALAAICTALVAVTQNVTREQIEENRQAFLKQSLAPMLEGIEYAGKLSDSTLIIPAPHGLPGRDDATVYRVYAGGQPIAAVFVVTARDGYSGPIRMLVGISASGVVNRVRVIEHSETPGLGDLIEKSRSDWIDQFDGRSLSDPAPEGWEVSRSGGEFDHLSSATITSRAVIRAVKETLVYFDENSTQIFTAAPSSENTGAALR